MCVGKDSSNGIVTRYRLHVRGGDRNPIGVTFSAHIQIGPGAHPASYTMCTRFPRGKVAGAWQCPPTSI